jgi:hypothetical protein
MGEAYRKLIQKSFPEGVDQTREKYIDRLFVVWDQCTKAVARYVISLLVIMTSFELINRAVVTELSVGPIKVVDVRVIETFLPVLAPYFMLRVWTELLRWREIERVYIEVMNYYYPALYETDLASLLHPASPLQSNFLTHREFASMRGLNFVTRFQGALGVVLMSLAPLFNFYAYWRLFTVHGLSTMTLISSMLSAILLGAYATLILLSRYGYIESKRV